MFPGHPSNLIEATSRRVSTFQIVNMPSVEAAASRLPLGEKATDSTYSFCPRDGRISFHVVVFQNLIELSALQVASIWPSGEKATPRTVSVWPVNITNGSCWGGTFQIFAAGTRPRSSSLPVTARIFPLGEKAS